MRLHETAFLTAASLVLALPAVPTIAADTTTTATPPRSSAMTASTSPPLHATGPFEARLAPQPPSSDALAATGIGRMSIAKQFHGTLEATSTGEMLAYGKPAEGSAGYVAIELVQGTLDGRSGSFALQHSSTLARGVPTQSITVVPDSGTGALTGLAGRMVVDIAAGGAHSYRFDFTLPDAAP